MSFQCIECKTKFLLESQNLNENNLNFRYLFHAFVILQTRHFWWSIDKNTDGITVQRSKSFQAVSQLYRQKFRTNQKLILVKGDEGSVTLRQLFHAIYQKNLFSNSFKFLTDHCKQFAYSVFQLATTNEE